MRREFSYTRDDFDRISAMLAADAGLCFGKAKAPLVYARLVKRLRALGMESFRDYCTLVETGDGGAERQIMVASLTTHVTSFFREPHHFAHLRETVLPALLQRARRGGKIRVWSAGCSSGEEPYSLAMTILDMAADTARLDIKILATDIDAHVLSQAREGAYGEAAIAHLDDGMRKRWFKRSTAKGSDAYAVTAAPRALVRFNALNLFAEWPMQNPFDVIMCRNVAIYFDAPARAQMWRRMAAFLPAGAHLYVGHSERIADARDLYEPAGVTCYRRLSGVE